MKFSLPIVPVAGLAVLSLVSGCSTIENCHRQKEPLIAAYLASDEAGMANELDDKLKEPSCFNSSRIGTGDELVWRLEAGTLAFVYGRYADAIREFTACEQVIADYDERAVVNAREAGAEVAGALSNANTLPYSGWCRDRMGVEIYKTLGYLGAGREDSFRAQVKRLRQRQKDIQLDWEKVFEREKEEIAQARKDNPNVAKEADEKGTLEAISGNSQNAAFSASLEEMKTVAARGYGSFLNPLATFLSALGNYRDGQWSNAAIDTERLHQVLSKNPFAAMLHATVLRQAGKSVPADLANVPAFSYPLDRDCLYVIFANGLGADLRQISVYWPMMCAWPVPEFHPAPFRLAQISTQGARADTLPLADMDAILAEEYEQRLPGIVARIVLSTLIKEATYYTALAATAHGTTRKNGLDLLATASVAAVGTAYRFAMNTADTRAWETLPKEFQIAAVPMPVDRKVHLELAGGAAACPIDVTIPTSARSAILFVNAPTANNVRCLVLPFTSK